MFQVRCKLFDIVDERSGLNDNGPWEIREQIGQVDGGANAPSYPFAVRLDKGQNMYEPGLYTCNLVPEQGRFRNSISWKMQDFHKVESK